MSPVNMKEFQDHNRALHELRLRQLKASVLQHRYQVDPAKVASGIIRELCSWQERRL